MILNIYLNGYEGKLTAKNWSKLAEVSLDTATRDVKDLVAKGILSPIQGRVRDVSYTLNYVERISPLDKMRFEQKEMSIDDLVYKYFAYLIG